MSKSFLNVVEAADFLGVSPMTVYRMAKRAALPAEKVGRCWRFTVQHLREWMRRQRPTLAQDPAFQKFLQLGRANARRLGGRNAVAQFLQSRRAR